MKLNSELLFQFASHQFPQILAKRTIAIEEKCIAGGMLLLYLESPCCSQYRFMQRTESDAERLTLCQSVLSL
jgi:hypothetical protein